MAHSEKTRGPLARRILSSLLLLPSWFSPHASIRRFFHRARGVKIGRNVEIGYFCIIGNVFPSLITIEDDAVITAKAVVLEHDYSYCLSRGGKPRIGPVLIKRNAFIGVNAVILPNITIGEQAIVAANSLVVRNVPDRAVVIGVPAEVVQTIGYQ